jgi:hypothetical protein
MLHLQATHQDQSIQNIAKADEDYAGIVEKVQLYRASAEASV